MECPCTKWLKRRIHSYVCCTYSRTFLFSDKVCPIWLAAEKGTYFSIANCESRSRPWQGLVDSPFTSSRPLRLHMVVNYRLLHNCASRSCTHTQLLPIPTMKNECWSRVEVSNHVHLLAKVRDPGKTFFISDRRSMVLNLVAPVSRGMLQQQGRGVSASTNML